MVQNEEKANTPSSVEASTWSDDAAQAQNQEDPPAACAEIIFAFHHHRMEKSDDEKRADADDKSREMQAVENLHALTSR